MMILATLCYIKHDGCTLMVYRNKKPMIFTKASGMVWVENLKQEKHLKNV